jgi:membrane fusion protein, copper/silver efflux system
MRQMTLAVAAVAAISVSFGLGRYYSHSQTDSKTRRHVVYYVDPMHPAYTSNKPGIAPDCGMQLVPVYSDEIGYKPLTSTAAQLPAGAVSVDVVTQRLLGIRTAPAEKADAIRTVRVVGRVVPEDTRVYSVNSGVDGFIRETFEDSVGTQVKKDQKLATYYAPDFLAAASGFLAATERVPGYVGKDGARLSPDFGGPIAKEGVKSIQGYTDRLRNLGMSDEQIKRVAVSRELPESIDVVAPADGFVLARNISPGQHFDHMMEFYRIADLSRVWVVAEVFEQEAANLHPGSMAQVTLREEGSQLPAHLTDSLPQSEPGGGTVKLRLELENPKFVLRPNMLVDVGLPVRLPPAVTVPLDALVDSGEKARVYVEHSEGVFEPREVETGWRTEDRVEILRGVQPGERVVVAATFLVDSESRLKSPDVAMSKPTPARPLEAMPKHMANDKKVAKDPVGSISKHQGAGDD